MLEAQSMKLFVVPRGNELPIIDCAGSNLTVPRVGELIRHPAGYFRVWRVVWEFRTNVALVTCVVDPYAPE